MVKARRRSFDSHDGKYIVALLHALLKNNADVSWIEKQDEKYGCNRV